MRRGPSATWACFACLAWLTAACREAPSDPQQGDRAADSRPSQAESEPPVREAASAEPSLAEIDRFRSAILAHATLAPGMTVADIGASGGWFVDRGAIAIGPEGIFYATDIDPQAIATLEQYVARSNPVRARVEVRHCQHVRDTGLGDLPADHVDVILMIDSLCFEDPTMIEADVAYLHELWRILAPGGRLIHHMDCRCRTTPQAVLARFEAAGFVRVADEPSLPPAPSYCSTAAQRELHALVLTSTKP